ncbi:hypothetical protein [Caldicellulosiruptor danielii]|uniref:Amino acid ABC transporter substrate-binding protein n=1 Tax=Anaerocellum danielii TaxID=1387557 RepID=A0ABZ0U0D2_9FIRM|nr:hypothetical protein [Caldicellulosiruptor danielii]WPX08083.1 hypothetical protein SOJ16_001940 [Caldicellulosiruptor danielii]
MYKKAIALVLLISLFIPFLSGCSSNDQNMTTLEKIKKTKEFVVGMDNTFPPNGVY